MGNRKVSSMIEEVDSGAQHMEKKEDLENTREAIEKFEGRISAEVRR